MMVRKPVGNGSVAAAAPTAAAPVLSAAARRRARILGIVFLGVAVLILLAFAMGTPGGLDSRFVLNPVEKSPVWRVPDLVVPSRGTAFVLAGACFFLAGIQLVKGFGKRATAILGVVALLLVFAFLTWGARDRSLNLTGMLQSTLLLSVPITFGALSGVLCERSAVINIGIEGMLLAGAFTGAFVGSATHNMWIGLTMAALVGGVLAWILAVLSIRYRVDQIITGTFINIFALGLTSYLSARVLQENQALNDPGRFPSLAIPVLSKIPVIGPVLFDNNIIVYVMFALIAAIHIGLFYTRWGLRVRAVGEHPMAADTVGIRVLFTRYRNVVMGGMVAGIGGAFFTLGSVGRFDENMTAGRGFIGLAAMIFGRWNPIGAFAAALLFGFADSLQTKLSILEIPVPSEFLLMAPYIATILVVAGAVRRARPPAADGKPYVKEGSL